MNKRSYGYIQSPADNRDIIFGSVQESSLPEDYILKDVHRVVDQGTDPICAAISLSHIIEWQLSARDVKLKENTPWNIYKLRGDENMQGMIPREALKALQKTGIGNYKIGHYARVNTIEGAKEAILTNGPLLTCFEAYDRETFWIPEGSSVGGHAVLLTGWEGNHFVLQNSWGTQWGDGGKMMLPASDWRFVLEAWTILI